MRRLSAVFNRRWRRSVWTCCCEVRRRSWSVRRGGSAICGCQKGWKKPLADDRLLILSFFDDKLRRPTAAIAAERNAYVAALASRLLIAHAEKGGKTEKLCKDALARGKPVFALDSPDNAHLIEFGAVPVSVADITPLILGTEEEIGERER